MKTGTSSLNPYAASYIPISRRVTADGNKDYSLTAKDHESGNETIWSGPYSENMTQNQHQHQSKASQNYIAHGTLTLEDSAPKENLVHGFYGSSSENAKDITEKQILDEVFDMHLAYLQMTFPGISYESLSDVYSINKGDLEDTVDMLDQFEFNLDDFSENLPHALDIGDLSESGSSSERASLKLKEVTGEVAGSSSGSPESAPVT